MTLQPYILLSAAALLLSSCDSIQTFVMSQTEETVEVQRFDRLEYKYITTGDFFSLQQMCTDYPTETRTLIEDVLKIGQVDKQDVNAKLIAFFQDSTLQRVARDAEIRFANINALNEELNEAFHRLKRMIPHIDIPMIYTQIGSLDQSIIIKDGSIGISLDKYLGEDYPLYEKYYDEKQRQGMNSDKIAPDCILFYLLSLYPIENFRTSTQAEKDDHIGRMFWATNKIMGRKVYDVPPLWLIEQSIVKENPDITVEEMLKPYMK